MSKSTHKPDAIGGVGSVPASMPASAPDQAAGAEVKSYEPTSHERAAVERLRSRRNGKPPAPRFTVSYEGDTVTIEPDHIEPVYAHALLTDMVATGDTTFSVGLLDQIANVARSGKKLTARDLNFALSTVSAIGPRDPVESLLAAQMMAIHNATMVAARRLNQCDTITQQDSASNMLNKLARTFAAQVEALKRYRSSGEQSVKVTHQHVSVTAGQAVVGINQGGGGAHENASQSHALGARPAKSSPPHARGPALLGQEQALGVPLPVSGSEGPERVPHARRTGRSANG